MENNAVKWKVYVDEFQTNEARLEFSNYGEVMSYSKNCPEGRLINGGLQEGYPIIRYKRMKPLDEESSKILNDFGSQILELRTIIKAYKVVLNKKSTTYEESRKIERKMNPKAELLAELLQKQSKARSKINAKRAIYKHVLVHKAVAKLFVQNDNPQEKQFVIHINYDKEDNKAENLAWATKEEVVEHGLKSPRWVKYNLRLERKEVKRREHAKLSYGDVVFIKRKLNKGEPMARLARRFGVSDMQIYRIKTGENWADVKVSFLDDKKSEQEEASEVQI